MIKRDRPSRVFNPPTDDYLVNFLHLLENDAAQWFESAKALRRSAELMVPTIESELAVTPVLALPDISVPYIDNVFMMLIGFSMENFLKGIIITRRPDLLRTKRDRRRIFGHDLNDLIELSKIHISDDERHVANRLTQYSLWIGRYPSPKSIEDLAQTFFSDSKSSESVERSDIRRPPIELIRRFLDRLETELWSCITPAQLRNFAPLMPK